MTRQREHIREQVTYYIGSGGGHKGVERGGYYNSNGMYTEGRERSS